MAQSREKRSSRLCVVASKPSPHKSFAYVDDGVQPHMRHGSTLVSTTMKLAAEAVSRMVRKLPLNTQLWRKQSSKAAAPKWAQNLRLLSVHRRSIKRRVKELNRRAKAVPTNVMAKRRWDGEQKSLRGHRARL